MASKERKTTSDVAHDLAKHEVQCAERWKTAFNRFDSIEESVQEINGSLKKLSSLSLAETLCFFQFLSVFPLFQLNPSISFSNAWNFIVYYCNILFCFCQVFDEEMSLGLRIWLGVFLGCYVYSVPSVVMWGLVRR